MLTQWPGGCGMRWVSSVLIATLAIGCGSGCQDSLDGKPPRSTSSLSSRSYLTGRDDGYAWRRASVDQRMSLCQDISRRMADGHLGSRNANWYYSLVDSYFDSSDEHVLQMKIGEIVALGVTVAR